MVFEVVDVEGIVVGWNNGSDGNIIGSRHRKLGNHSGYHRSSLRIMGSAMMGTAGGK